METSKLNCVLLHGCPSAEEDSEPATRTYDKHWLPWVKHNLNAAGIAVETPHMPAPWAPSYQDFRSEFEKLEVNENTILIGHSCGAAFLVRWLGDTKRVIHQLILVAPWKIPAENDEGREEFYNYPIDEGIRARVNEIVMFTADDEEAEGKQSLTMFHDALGGEIVELNGYGHYTLNDMGTQEFPELLERIVRFDHRKALLLPVNSQQKILLQDRRGYKKPDWGFFGGEIEAGESPTQAVIRETREELQIDVDASQLKYLGTSITFFSKRVGELRVARYLFLYRTSQEEFDVLEGNGGHWLSFDEARERMDDRERLDDIADRIRKAEHF